MKAIGVVILFTILLVQAAYNAEERRQHDAIDMRDRNEIKALAWVAAQHDHR